MQITRELSLGLLGVLLAGAALCQSLPVANRPEDVGISSQRLERVRRQMQADVESGRIPGAVLLIARHGKIARLDALGFQERKSQTPMKSDSIFRIASMSKPITSVAIMMLAEEGKLDIGAPVAQYLPEFKDVRVGVEKAAPKRADDRARSAAPHFRSHLRHLRQFAGRRAVQEERHVCEQVAGRHGRDHCKPAAGAPARRVLGV